MNILIFSWRGPGHPHEGGAEQVTHEHAKSWVRAGHNVTLFTSSYLGSKKSETVNGVKIIREGHQIIWVQIAAIVWYIFKNKEKFDLVIDQFHGLPFFTPLFVRTKKLAFIHEVAKEVWTLNPLPKPISYLPTILGPTFEPLIFKLFYRKIRFLTVSMSTKSDLVAWGMPENNITVINNGVNLKLPTNLPKKEKTKTAIYLGALSKDKGIYDAIKVFKELDNHGKWQFWIVGKGTKDIINELKVEIKQSGITKKVKFWGFVSDEKKFELLARAHVMINTSIREGWGLVNIEANAVGTPVVGYRVAGVRDSVLDGKTGILVKQGNCLPLANEALELVRDKNKYKSMQKEATRWSKEFNWDKAGKESLEFIESLLSGDGKK